MSEYVINPLTKRNIKVNGVLYNKLLNKQIIKPNSPPRRVKKNEVKEKTKKIAFDVYKKNIHLFDSEMSSRKIESILSRLINQEMIQKRQKSKYVVDYIDDIEVDDIEDDIEDDTEETSKTLDIQA